jgi:hypothetical protein
MITEMQKTVQVEAKTLKVCAKCIDMFSASLYDQNGDQIGGDYDGYVPSIMPGDHDGDYVMLDIDIDTGQILNWVIPSKSHLKDFIVASEMI